MATLTLFEQLTKLFLTYCILPLTLLVSPLVGRLYSLCSTLTNSLKSPNTPEQHAGKVQKVIEQVIKWNQGGRKRHMCTGRKPWKTFSIHSISKDSATQIQLDLEDVVKIDTDERILTVEPGVMMGELTSTLLPLGWTIPVVPELDSLTVGGLVCGAGLETSSHKYGLFSDTCLAYEVVLPDGQLINCSKTENVDLFYAIPMSYGTIGFVTAVQIPLIKAGKYVKLEYVPIKSTTEAVEILRQEPKDHEFVEGIMYGPDNWVIMLGNMVNQADEKRVNMINRWYKPWFFKHAESIQTKTTEYIPLRDYYHRHTRAFFWEATGPFPYGNHPLFRALFGYVFPLNFQIIKLTIPVSILDKYYVTNHVVQDFVLPIRHLDSTLSFLHDLVQVYPLWICPAAGYKKFGFSGLGKVGEEMYVDVGVYGDTPKTQEYDTVKSTQAMEAFTIQHHGYQALYADSYLSRDDFNKMFDTGHYYKVRAQYNCEDAFPDVYDKISRQARQLG